MKKYIAAILSTLLYLLLMLVVSEVFARHYFLSPLFYDLKTYFNRPIENNELIIFEPSFNDEDFSAELIKLSEYSPAIVGVDFELTHGELAKVSNSISKNKIPFVFSYTLSGDPDHILFIDSLSKKNDNFFTGYVDIQKEMMVKPSVNDTTDHFLVTINRVISQEQAELPEFLYADIRNSQEDYEIINMDVLKKNPDLIKNKIVLYGDVFYGEDFFNTAKGRLPGIVILANLIESYKSKNHLKTNVFVDSIILLVILVTSIKLRFNLLLCFLVLTTLVVLFLFLFNFIVSLESIFIWFFISYKLVLTKSSSAEQNTSKN